MTDKIQRGPEIPETTSRWLDHGGPFPDTLCVKIYGQHAGSETSQYEILDRDDSGCIAALRNGRRGKKGFVLRVRQATTGQIFAAKLTIPNDFDDGTSPLSELDHSSKLRAGESFIHLLEAVGRVDRFASEPETDEKRAWVCFLSRWLEGSTLDECIRDNPARITPAVVVEIAETLVRSVIFLEMNGLKHDDLHLGNLMLVPNDPVLRAIDPLEPAEKLILIDLGSVKPTNRMTLKKDDDWSSLARCLVSLHNLLHSDRRVASRYSVFLRRFSEFIEKLADEDLARHFPEQSDYLRSIRDIETSLTISPHQQGSFQPFDAISAEHLANDKLLLDLFVDYLPWIDVVRTLEPSVLIGPRGCGKSMVFRYLSIRTHIAGTRTSSDVLDRHQFLGIYIGCASDLGNDLLWLAREKGRPTRLASTITTYFNLVLARELLRSLATCHNAQQIAEALGLSAAGVHAIISFLRGQIGAEFDVLLLRGSDALQSASDTVDRIRLSLSRDLLGEKESAIMLPTTFVRDLCRVITASVPGLVSKRIAFLLDDYTSHRLSPEIQRILNAVIWQRDHSFMFKISSEPYGFDAGHVDGAQIDSNREYTLINAGDLTISQENPADRRKFIIQLLDKRLEAANYLGRTATLIGESAYKSDKDLAAAIRSKDSRQGQRNYYHGIHVLADAWSGDVATVLHIIREMFARANVGPTTICLISAKDQHQSIVRVSKALNDRVRTYHPYGQEMAHILSNLGQLARRLLVDAPDHDDRSGSTAIHRKYRLELSLPPGVELDSKLLDFPNGDALIALKQELVRRAILIELHPSRAKEGEGRQTNRWQIRSSLLPNFGTSLTREGYIDVKRIEDFAELLTNPNLFADKVYMRYAKPRTGDLFKDLGGLND
ncbi:hypothetical protein [Azospirillum sp. TSA2s]|uniref:ORC-CDC6 family AAA ATPase n=1 Tax=Azospirillum sp. TSA2s TaxID=709810 RepID=UPI001B3BEDF2|nr:hypothetical protein [Azospirillum sp. TSA2s]